MAHKNRNSSGASRGSQWESLLRKFSEAHKVECKSVSVQIPRVQRSAKHYPTGSHYEGEWSVLGMSGQGVYTLPNGVIYKGELEDGQFHGKGELQYPSGVLLKGKWVRGEMVERTLFFDDGLEYSEVDWKYCKMPDRRFTIEYNKGLQPYNRTFMTADQPTRPVPAGFFDTGDGFFCPTTKMVYRADDLTAIVRAPAKEEQKWIVENCRTSPLEIAGPRPDLYEAWQKPDIDPIDTPEPVVASRRPTPPYSKNQDLEKEIVSLHLAWTRHSNSYTSSCCTNTDCYCYEELDYSKLCCLNKKCTCHVGRCCSNVDCVCDQEVEVPPRQVKSAHVRGAIYDSR